MTRDFNSTNRDGAFKKFVFSKKYQAQAFEDSLDPALKDVHFKERLHYGVVDEQNNSIIPIADSLISVDNGRLLPPVADSVSLMKLNLQAAIQRGHISQSGEIFGNMTVLKAYQNPKEKYGEYLGNILRFYNDTHIPNSLGIHSISSHKSYVKNFFKFILENTKETPITLTRWNTSYRSSILDTGLAFSFSNIRMDEDQRKVNEIIDNENFQYFRNLCLNMGFCISNSNPNILIYDIANPATAGILGSYGNYNLKTFFTNNFIKTYTLDMNLLITYINIYYNKYAQKNSVLRTDSIKCGRPHTTYSTMQTESTNTRIYSDLEELHLYVQIRNVEEGSPFSQGKVNNIHKRSKFLLKTLDKAEAMSYINSIFRDQLWNKDFGYDDLAKQLKGKTTTKSQRDLSGEDPFGGSY